VRPIGLPPGKNLRANESFTITTGRPSRASCASKSRPARSGMPYAANQRGVTKLYLALMRSLAGSRGMPVGWTKALKLLRSTGVDVEPAACATPGTLATAAMS
jgi:hypothetical protein